MRIASRILPLPDFFTGLFFNADANSIQDPCPEAACFVGPSFALVPGF
jgi:hypothetical protein